MSKPYSESCDRNRDPILSVIKPLLREHQAVLEIGSGTGQHAVYFAGQMPWLTWVASDRQENLDGIRQWLAEAGLANTAGPLLLDVTQAEWATPEIDAVFSANAVHIMHWDEVVSMFDGIGRLLPGGGRLMLYGPFNYHGEYSSDSNARFDDWLKARDPESGIRDFEAVDALAQKAGLVLEQDYEMPANNRILCWRKQKQG
jgi:cyclopropane fatty-acyl-phospholipid synthase-like methyltransferase